MKIIIVDDDCLVAGALKTILEANPDIEVTATGSDGEEACSLYREYLPDILLMDIRMKGMDGLEASRKILGEFPEAKILLLTTFSDDEYIVKALRLGTKGYLLKQDHTSILPALQAVLSSVVDPCGLQIQATKLTKMQHGNSSSTSQLLMYRLNGPWVQDTLRSTRKLMRQRI